MDFDSLTFTEYEIVKYLQEHPGVISPEELITRGLGYTTAGHKPAELFRTHVANIRRKLGADVIVTVRGRGLAWNGEGQCAERFRTDGWWGWPGTRMGINSGLRGRVGEPLQVIARSNRRSRGLAWVRFQDGFEVAAPAEAIRRTPHVTGMRNAG